MEILILSASKAFRQHISRILEENQVRDVVSASDLREGVNEIRSRDCRLMILDSFHGIPGGDLVLGFRIIDPGLKILLVSSRDEEITDVDQAPDLLLHKPFRVPELIKAVRTLLEISGHPALYPLQENGEDFVQPERDDIDDLSERLTQLSRETAARCALIIRKGCILAFTGQLSRSTAEKLAGEIEQAWRQNPNDDLARFIYLDDTGREHVAYATGLGGSALLTLIFNSGVPFSILREQTVEMAHALARIPAGELDQEDIRPGHGKLIDRKRDTRRILESFSDLMRDLQVPPADDSDQEGKPPEMIKFDFGRNNSQIQDRTSLLREKKEFPAGGDRQGDDQRKEEISHLLDTTSKINASQSRKTLKTGFLAPITRYYHNLSYICMLIPRLEQHQLRGAVADDLRSWVKQLCLAFGLRLKQLDLQPGYLQWVVIAPPGAAPAALIEKIQEHTSRRLFQNYPSLVEENPSGDFWAVGCVLISGRKLLPDSLIKRIISRIRIQQGS